jgi:hypothetical protein
MYKLIKSLVFEILYMDNRIIVVKFSSQYFDLKIEESSDDLENFNINLENIKSKIIYNLQKIFEDFNFEKDKLVVISSGAVRLGKLVSNLFKFVETQGSIINAVYATI